MANILSIETGTDVCSVCLSVDGELISIRESAEGKNHINNIAVFIDDIFRHTSVSSSQIDAVAVSLGPGSYTGLRIGVSLAKGLCYANNIPLISVNSLLSLVECAIEENKIGTVEFDDDIDIVLIPMIDARRMEVYTQTYSSDGIAVTEVEAKVLDNNSFSEYAEKRVIIFGSGAKKCFELLDLPNKTLIELAPSARGMIKEAHSRFESGKFEDLAYFEPLYLKDFIGTKSKKDYFK